MCMERISEMISRGDVFEPRFKFLGLLTVLNITFQLVSDVTAGKIISVFGVGVSITVIYFPVTYIMGDILTEVYGYARARYVVWLTLLASVLAGPHINLWSQYLLPHSLQLMKRTLLYFIPCLVFYWGGG